MVLASTDVGAVAVNRARTAVARFTQAPGAEADGMLPAAHLALGSPIEPVAAGLIERYRAQRPGYGRDNARRYRWSLGFRDEPGHVAYLAEHAHESWQPKEEPRRAERPDWYARRLTVPVTLATQLEFWSRAAESTDLALAAAARELLDETQLVADADVARWVAGDDPWADTFALWLITSHPAAHARLRDLTFALAIRYAQLATRYGVVPGIRYPFFGQPLTSATAHLATALWRLGIYPSRLPQLLDFVAHERHADGGWGDPEQPSDVLTTLAAAELASSLNPDYDPTPTITFFARHQEPAGWWRALNPEVPWLTGAIASWISRATTPFADRFAWPMLPIWSRDRTTGLPTMAVFDELSVALAGITGLSGAALEMAFIDLAGFGEFNLRYGQDAGDAALAAYAGALATMPGTLTIRQGGDELLVLGLPTLEGRLEPAMRAFMEEWAAASQTVGVPPGSVLPRVVLARGTGGDLRVMRGKLGTFIGEVKRASPEPAPPGVLQWL